jgi:hypothetical protein
VLGGGRDADRESARLDEREVVLLALVGELGLGGRRRRLRGVVAVDDRPGDDRGDEGEGEGAA